MPILVLSEKMTVKSLNTEIDAEKGDSIFIPSGLKVTVFGDAEILYSEV